MIVMDEKTKAQSAKEKVGAAGEAAKRYGKKLANKFGEHAESDEGLNSVLGLGIGAAVGEAMLGMPTLGFATAIAAGWFTFKGKE